MGESFLGAALKIERAKQHIDTLTQITEPLDGFFYSFGWRPGTDVPAFMVRDAGVSDADAPVMELAFVPEQPISEWLGVIMGDAIHNLRAALDFGATAVVRAAKHDTSFVTFPFHEERDKLEAPQSKGIRAIQAALPNADVETFFRDEIKSYRGGNTPLWTLTKLDKIDKHNFIVPVVTVSRIEQMGEMRIGGDRLSNQSLFGRNLRHPYAIYRGSIAPEDIPECEVKISVDVSFPQGEHFSGAPVIPTLVDLVEVVTKALGAFEKFAVANGSTVNQ